MRVSMDLPPNSGIVEKRSRESVLFITLDSAAMTLWPPHASPIFGLLDPSIRPKHPATSPMAPIRPCLQDLLLASLVCNSRS